MHEETSLSTNWQSGHVQVIKNTSVSFFFKLTTHCVSKMWALKPTSELVMKGLSLKKKLFLFLELLLLTLLLSNLIIF